jgi:uncharacterized protein YcbX
VTSDWPIGREGLKYDRNWLLVDEFGTALNQKRVPKMCMIVPVKVDLVEGFMMLSAPGMSKLRIGLRQGLECDGGGGEVNRLTARVCGDRYIL